MNSTLSKVLIFVGGAATGAVVTWRLLKPYYDKIVNEELVSIREAYARKYGEQTTEEPPTDEPEEIADLSEDGKQYVETIVTEGYMKYSDIKQMTKDIRDLNQPYVIAPEEFGDMGDYDIEYLTYYADGTLANEMDEPIIDVEDVVGANALNHFGTDTSEPELVFVRNDELRKDFEISLDSRKYSDVVNNGPQYTED